MSVRAVKAYLKTFLDGATVSTMPGTLTGRVVPQPFDLLSNPTYWLWADSWREERAGNSRSPEGRKAVTYRMRISLMADVDVDHMDPSAFDDLTNKVISIVRTIPIDSVNLTDPTTGEQSQLLRFGEDFDVQNPQPFARSDQGIWRYESRLFVTTWEWTAG